MKIGKEKPRGPAVYKPPHQNNMIENKQLTHYQIRSTFLEFFEKKGHKILPSFSLIPENDPSLLFVAAGMVPFKAEFAGKITPKYRRVSTCQKCFRMDDIENIGFTLRHHTFFEMLGNFSFGDYFKKESIYWAYELLTDVYKIDPSKLYFSCHTNDDEAEQIWLSLGIDKERIVRLEDNFWGPAGPTGPCGPSSEIFYENFYCPDPNCKPGFECVECEKKERFIEIWNIVFTEYFKESDGTFSPLPQKNIDTGMGLERLTKILQNKENQYLTDLFLPLIEHIQQLIHKDIEEVYNEMKIKFDKEKYREYEEIYKRIVADHCRGAVFLISDGVVPSNDGRGYVLRKLIRRSLLYSKLLGIKNNFLKTIPDVVEKIFKEVYPEVSKRKDFVKKVLENEENGFYKNLLRGLEYLSKFNIKKLTGKDAFFLYDTLGFPVELTLEIAKSQNFTINMEEFYKELEIQRERSRQRETDIKVFSVKENFSTDFVGYEKLETEAKIIGIIKKENDKYISLDYYDGNEDFIIITDQTPFYAESGGQVGDRGKIENSEFSFVVNDTQKHIEGFIFHIGRLEWGVVKKGTNALLKVDKNKRFLTAANHTATHLLHAALRKVLGHHVYQAGSLVHFEKLRFDFTHFDNLTDSDLENIENLVNEKIVEGIDVEVEYKPYSKAIEEGAIALFAEKYPDVVRTVKISDFSYELCGGTHVKNTSSIGVFRIYYVGSVQMGVKRIEAVTSVKTLEQIRKIQKIIDEIKSITKTEESQLFIFIQKLLNENKELSAKNKELKNKLYSKLVEEELKAGKSDLSFKIENEQDLFFIHDNLKNKMKYSAVFDVNGKKIIVFHKDFSEKFANLYPGKKLIPFGDYFKIIL